MGSITHLAARTDARNGVVRLALRGEIDLDSAPLVTDHLARFEADGVDAIILDLREVTFIDSSGLHAFLHARKRADANGHSIVLVGASRRARRLFELTGSESLFDDPSSAVLGRFAVGGSSDRTAEGEEDS